MKRYIRIDIEYDTNESGRLTHSFSITDNIRRILAEDMPYCKVIFTRDAPNRDDLDNPVNRSHV